MAGAHEDAHQLGDVLVAHVLLEVGRRHGRIAEPTRDRDGAVRVGRVLQECDAELGAHRSGSVRPWWLQPWREPAWYGLALAASTLCGPAFTGSAFLS